MLSQEAIHAAKSLADDAVEAKPGINGLVFSAVQKDGGNHVLAAGVKHDGAPMTSDDVFWVMSCTKLITTICCMQLVEQGKLRLDDSDHLEELLPELRDKQVLKPDGSLEPKKRGITLRMLLTHTAGFAYAFWNERLHKWFEENGLDHVSREASFKAPLVTQPGETWLYGMNTDWAGFAVEKATGMSLGEYMKSHVFQPLGVIDTSLLPTEAMAERVVEIHARVPDGSLQPMGPQEPSWGSGGMGLFTTAPDYCRILTALLNDGTCPSTNANILSRSSVDEIFTNQIPDQPDFGRQGLKSVIPFIANGTDDLYPVPGNPPQGWGLAGMLTPTTTGRSPTGMWWAGAGNTYWWVDREKGVAGVVFTQIMPFLDRKVLETWHDFETLVYNDIAKK